VTTDTQTYEKRRARLTTLVEASPADYLRREHAGDDVTAGERVESRAEYRAPIECLTGSYQIPSAIPSTECTWTSGLPRRTTEYATSQPKIRYFTIRKGFRSMTYSFVHQRVLRNLAFLLLAAGLVCHGQTLLTNPRWKVQVLIYDRIDFQFTDNLGNAHHIVTSMTQQEKDLAVAAATKFLGVDVPALDSGNMIPLGTIKIVSHPLTSLSPVGSCEYPYWPDPTVTAPDRDAANFDSAIIIFQESGVDLTTGRSIFVGCFGGLTYPRGTGQTYTSFIFRIFSSDQRNVFKHEWGHSILFYYDAAGTAPKPSVDNHIGGTNLYVHCGTGVPYILVDDSDSAPVPNSIYNDQTGFTHDYYSGTTAKPDHPNSCLGITPIAWASGGPVTHPITHPGDLNGDNQVDIVDLELLMQHLNQPAAGPNDPRDLDYDGQITIMDARILIAFCTKTACTEPPLITPTISGTRGANGWYTSPVTVSWTVVDPVGVVSSKGCSTTSLTSNTAGVTLTCSATNGVGLTSTASVIVKIDRTSPIIAGMPSACALWPVSHNMIHVANISAGAFSGLAFFAVNATSSEPSDPNEPDVLITGSGLDPRTVQVRAERLGSGNGRVYTITATATSLAGNTTSSTGVCTVPHDQSR